MSFLNQPEQLQMMIIGKMAIVIDTRLSPQAMTHVLSQIGASL